MCIFLNTKIMEAYIKSPNTKRFVVEDSITKVTSDGEPHELMTMVAVLSGLLAAVVILAVVVSMVTCRNSKASSNLQTKSKATAPVPAPLAIIAETSNKANDSGSNEIYNKSTSILSLPRTSLVCGDKNSARRLAGNLNVAFLEGTEMNLCGGKYRTPNWQETVAAEGQTRETYIQVERY